MARSISQSTRDEITAPQSGVAFLQMVELTWSETEDPLYFVQNNVNVVSSALGTSETYVAANFSIKIPNESESEVQDSSITISGINRQITEIVRSIENPPTIRMFIVREDTPNTIERGPFSFKLRNTNITLNSISGSLLYEYTLRNNISTMSINSQIFPGLF